MMEATVPTTFIDNAKVMAKGQVTIPKDVRKVSETNPGAVDKKIFQQRLARYRCKVLKSKEYTKKRQIAKQRIPHNNRYGHQT